MVVFKYLEDKDVFQTFYATRLCKCLIHDELVSQEAEASMIWKLREAYGFEYTNKFGRMFTGTQQEQVSMTIIDVFNRPLQI